MEATARPIKDAGGRVIEVMLIHEDVTERLTAEQARQEVERRNQEERERLERLFEQAPSFMALLDGPAHRFVLANPKYAQLVGREVIGKTVVDALPDAAAQGYVALLDRVYETGQSYSAFSSRFEVQASRDAAAVEHFIDFVIHPIRDTAAKVSGIFVKAST